MINASDDLKKQMNFEDTWPKTTHLKTMFFFMISSKHIKKKCVGDCLKIFFKKNDQIELDDASRQMDLFFKNY